MAAEYSYIPVQTVAEDENVLFMDGDRACKKGCVTHRSGSGVFHLNGARNTCKTIYIVRFNANIAVAAGGTVGPITIALQEDGETLGNALATVTPAAIGDFFNVSFGTPVYVSCGNSVTISVKNISAGTAIDVRNANIIIDRVA